MRLAEIGAKHCAHFVIRRTSQNKKKIVPNDIWKRSWLSLKNCNGLWQRWQSTADVTRLHRHNNRTRTACTAMARVERKCDNMWKHRDLTMEIFTQRCIYYYVDCHRSGGGRFLAASVAGGRRNKVHLCAYVDDHLRVPSNASANGKHWALLNLPRPAACWMDTVTCLMTNRPSQPSRAAARWTPACVQALRPRFGDKSSVPRRDDVDAIWQHDEHDGFMAHIPLPRPDLLSAFECQQFDSKQDCIMRV